MFYEPMTKVTMDVPTHSRSLVVQLCEMSRGKELENKMLTEDKDRLVYRLPDAEIMVDFFTRLMSITRFVNRFKDFVIFEAKRFLKDL